MKHLDVVAGIIIYQNRILCMQRKESDLLYISKKYEFPGGKIEENESAICALARELKEEMEIEAKIAEKDFFGTVFHQYPDFSITMHAYKVYVNNPQFMMKDHLICATAYTS